jgi:hypothetical protein
VRKKNDFVVHFQLGETERSFEKDKNFLLFTKKNPMMAQLLPIIFINNNVNTHHLHALSPFSGRMFVNDGPALGTSTTVHGTMFFFDENCCFFVYSPLHSFASRAVPRAHGRSK